MNDGERERRLTELLAESLDLDAESRRRYLDEACADDSELRRELETLLAEDTDDFLQVPVVDAIRLAPAPERFGPYRVLDTLGSGGMGTVYLAEQQEPVRRRVALKVIDAATEQVRKRFAAESQALARLAHPNVASLYEAGTTEDGRAFAAMELIDGTAIHTWCDEEALGMKERIELFLGICAGVRHAHEKGILHRDLKPSNILVTVIDGRPVAKVIDFGIARSLGEPLHSGGRMTLDNQLIGSPAYMSPEAATFGFHDVDARSDIYSLGLLLYDLLVGVLPFDTAQEDLTSFLRRLSREDAPPPTVRFDRLERDERDKIAARRGLTRSALVRRIRGDLDAIVLKAIARDRDLRYSSAGELADDLRSHLEDRPIRAQVENPIYVFRKFARRHRAAVTAAVALLIALLVGLAAVSLAFVRARQAETRVREDLAHAHRLIDDAVTEMRGEHGHAGEPPSALESRQIREKLFKLVLRYDSVFIAKHADEPARRAEVQAACQRRDRVLAALGRSEPPLSACVPAP